MSAASDIYHVVTDRTWAIAPGEAITVNDNGEPGRRKKAWFDVIEETPKSQRADTSNRRG